MPVITATEYLEVESIPLATPAWRLDGLAQLWDEAEVKGADLDIPYADGGISFPRNRKITTYGLPIHIFGTYNQEGVVYPDPMIGLYTNFAYLRDNVFAPVESGAGYRAADLHLPDGSVLSSFLVPLGSIHPKRKGSHIQGQFSFTVPFGSFIV